MGCDQSTPCKKYQVPNKIRTTEASTKSVARKLEKVVVPVRSMWKKFTVKNMVRRPRITRYIIRKTEIGTEIIEKFKLKFVFLVRRILGAHRRQQ